MQAHDMLVSFPDHCTGTRSCRVEPTRRPWRAEKLPTVNMEQTGPLVPPLRVLLWSAPRCVSTTFERSIRELKSVKVIHESHQSAYLYGPERKTDCYIRFVSDINPSATYQAADEKLLRPYGGYQAVFAKNVAYNVEGRYENYIEGRFAGFKHTFLMRHPRKSITSIMKVYEECGGYSVSPADEHGFQQLHDFYQVVRKVDPSPVVIDADDLLMYPREIMEQYCIATGLPFEEGMLHWTPGEVPDWTGCEDYKVWHRTAMASCGLVKHTPSETALATATVDLPRDVEYAIQQALPFYEALYAVRMKPSHGL